MRARALFFVAIATGCHQIVGIEPLRDPPPDAGAAPGPEGPGPFTSSVPDAAPDAPDAPTACAPSKIFEPFAAAAVPDGWVTLLANGAAVDFSSQASSPPVSLHARGPLTETAGGRALIRTTRQGPIRGRVDLSFQMSFDGTFSDARMSAGCMLELARADSTSVRARIAVQFGPGTDPGGVTASVDVSKNASPAAPPSPPAPVQLSNQIEWPVWYLFHIRAVADGERVSFDFDKTGGGPSGSATGLTVPFGEVTSLALSCGVDDAYALDSGSSATFSVLVDDVALDVCP